MPEAPGASQPHPNDPDIAGNAAQPSSPSATVRLLLDRCVSRRCVEPLVAAGFDVVHSSALGRDPGDAVLLKIAHEQGRFLITQDKDFGELWLRSPPASPGVVRLVMLPVKQQSSAILKVLTDHAVELGHGALVTHDGVRIRVRPRPT